VAPISSFVSFDSSHSLTDVVTCFLFPPQDSKGAPFSFDKLKGKVVYGVNVASKCGYTASGYALLEKVAAMKDRGVEVLIMPCNQFGGQEPGTEAQILEFCTLNYEVSFPMYGKVEVNGEGTHPLYAHLKSAAPGLLGSESLKWNFTKFLISPDGETIKRFAPSTTPEDIRSDIKALLPNE